MYSMCPILFYAHGFLKDKLGFSAHFYSFMNYYYEQEKTLNIPLNILPRKGQWCHLPASHVRPVKPKVQAH